MQTACTREEFSSGLTIDKNTVQTQKYLFASSFGWFFLPSSKGINIYARFLGGSLHCVVEVACVVTLCDQFGAAVKAAFNSRDNGLVT